MMNNRYYKAGTSILILLCGLYLFSLWHTAADIDDGWLGEQAYWLAKDGYVKSELMRGITQQEAYLIVNHKLLVLNGALFIKMFGFSINSIKAVSLLYFIMFLLLFLYYSRKNGKDSRADKLILEAILIICFPWTFKYSFVFRPEIMLMTFTFGSWILLEKILENKRHGYLMALATGLLGGLSFSTHLNGIIIPIAGFIMLLINKKFRHSILLVLGALTGALVYFYDFNSTYGLQFWWMQFSQSPSLDSLPGSSPWIQPFINLMSPGPSAPPRVVFH